LFTTKATVYFSMAIGLLTLALLLDDFELGILVLGLASLFFFSNILGLPEKVEIKLHRRIIPDETFGDEEIRVESYIRNLTGTSLVNAEIHEVIDGRITPDKGTTRIPVSIAPNKESRPVFEFPSPPRSNYTIGPMIARVRDPFGFYLTETKLDPGSLCVMPRPERLRGMQLRPRHVGPWPGVIPSKVLGIGTEFYSMREYVPGDDPKRINWKASARYNSLIINETEAERVTDVMVVLDSDVTFYGPVEGEMFERGVQAAASISSHLLRQGNRVGLVLQGSERGSVSAGFGKRHERRILYLLAAAKPGRAKVSTSYIMSLLASRMLPFSAQIVIVSSLLDPEMKEGVRQLAMAGYSMLILSPTPTAPSTFQDSTEEIAFKLVMLERSITLLALERSSTIIDWPRGIPLSAVMTKVRRFRPIVAA
jgi:uncharacterized protein (DUF58 family)